MYKNTNIIFHIAIMHTWESIFTNEVQTITCRRVARAGSLGGVLVAGASRAVAAGDGDKNWALRSVVDARRPGSRR